jgi:hypothetical protein
MARTKINSKSKDLMSDDGSVLVSLIHGEQIRMAVTLGWLTNLSGYTIVAKCVEADSRSLVWEDNELPLVPQSGGQTVVCPIVDTTVTDNTFEIVFPETLANSFTTMPKPQRPAYAWFGLEVTDSGTGNNKLVFKPMRGLVEILYSPSEAA